MEAATVRHRTVRLTDGAAHTQSSRLPAARFIAQLEVLTIGCAFNQQLTAVLPFSLRILRLTGLFDQPLTPDVFTSTQRLEELYLSDFRVRQLALSILPRSLRVLRVGKHHSLVILHASDAVPQLSRVIVAAG